MKQFLNFALPLLPGGPTLFPNTTKTQPSQLSSAIARSPSMPRTREPMQGHARLEKNLT
jgi:hypothetical protein